MWKRNLTLAWIVVGALLVGAGFVSAKGGPKPPPEPPPVGPAYTIVDLGTLGGGGSEAHRVNEAGQVVGGAFDASGVWCPFLVTPEDTDGNGKPDRWYRDDDGDGVNDLMVFLGLLGGGNSVKGVSRDINDDGVVVGRESTDGTWEGWHGWVWRDTDEGLIDLGSHVAGIDAYAINNHGQVVGRMLASSHSYLITPEDNDGDGIPDLWFKDADGDSLNDLLIDLGESFSRRDINDAGLIAGMSGYVSGFVLVPEDTNGDGAPDSWWRDDDGDGYNDLLVELSPLGSGETLSVEGINPWGQIAGSSTTGSRKDRKEHAVRWENDGTATDLGVFKDWDFARGMGINADGDVVGWGRTTGDVDVAFLWTDGEMYKLLDLLTDAQGIAEIAAHDINGAGFIVGYTNRGAFIAVPTGN